MNDSHPSAFWDLNEQGRDLNPGYLDLNLTAPPLRFIPLLSFINVEISMRAQG